MERKWRDRVRRSMLEAMRAWRPLSALSAALLGSCAALTGDPRLLEDCGGFRPTADLLDAATALTTLDAETPQRRVDILRAGLRLRDRDSARACAARLSWNQIDRWESARCVDLLVDDVLRPGTEVRFDEFRSYIGSVELPRYLRALPPLPWAVEPGPALGHMHRILRAEHIPLFVELSRSPVPEIAQDALDELALLGLWNDECREEVEAAFLDATGGSSSGIPPPDGRGLPPVLAAGLRHDFLDSAEGDPPYTLPHWDRRWLWECRPGPRDAELLMSLAEHGDTDWTAIAGTALVLLGRLSDPETDAYLRRRAGDGEVLAGWALARRGDPEWIERLAADAAEGREFALALLMEIAPPRARRLLEETLLGPDDDAAHGMLGELREFALPGAPLEPLGFDWRRTSFEGLDRLALKAGIPALRLARIGAVVPGCRTRAIARAAALALRPGDLAPDEEGYDRIPALPAVGGFLETGAPAEFAASLRGIRDAGGADAALATEWLVRMADPEACEKYAARMSWDGWPPIFELARSRVPRVRRILAERVAAARGNDEAMSGARYAAAALAACDGLPEATAATLGDWYPAWPEAAVNALLAGRPVDALAEILASAPDEEHGDVGAVNDPRVRAYLERLRARRDLGQYWYATGQLAAAGDPEARQEFWGAMRDGRYRPMDSADAFPRTLGYDLEATMPFWIDELRSQCCRIVTNGAGDIVEELLGLEGGCYESRPRTAWRRAKELWDAAGGTFVRSRIAEHWVPAPR